MSFTYRPAVREQCYTLTGIAGPSGSGKTFSALRFAKGLGGTIAMIDTEARRGLHYADQFEYLYGELDAPFTPARYIGAIQDAANAGANAIIVDSMSHEHEGPGGILEMHEAALTRMAGDDYRKREQCKFAAWIEPKAEHNRFVNTILQVKAHLIFCFRAKEKLKLVRNQKGKMEPMPLGWQPICSDRFEYEMTALMMLPPNSQGVPDLAEGATKLQEQHRGIFATGNQIDENMGTALATWAAGTAPSKPTSWDLAQEAANKGTEAFRAWWNNGGKPHRAAVKDRLDELKAIASKADSAAEPDEDPFDGEEEDPAKRLASLITDIMAANSETEVKAVKALGDDLPEPQAAQLAEAADAQIEHLKRVAEDAA